MVLNCFMRIAWTLTLSTVVTFGPFEFATILALVEILRRTMWNLFRLENEQLHNLEKYRDINVIGNFKYKIFNLILKTFSSSFTTKFLKLYCNCKESE